MKVLFFGVVLVLSTIADVCAEETTQTNVEVGKHVAANMDAMSMILSLLMVLSVIVVAALILKRFQGVQTQVNGLKIISSLHLGAKEKLVVVQAGDKQLVLGVTSQQITLIETLEQPLLASKISTPEISKVFSNILKNKTTKAYDKQE